MVKRVRQSQTSPHPPAPKAAIQVGDRVGIQMGSRVVPAIVIEDGGLVGNDGERLIRVSVQATTSTSTTFEVLLSTLLPNPGDESREAERTSVIRVKPST